MEGEKGVDIPGMAITILVCNNYTVTDKREDISLLDTVTNILDCLDTKFECYKPITPTDEDLFAGYSETKKENVTNSFKTLKIRLNKAIYEEKNEKRLQIYCKKNLVIGFQRERIKISLFMTEHPLRFS